MAANGHSATVYEMIGGQEAVNQAVNILYEKLLSDGNCRQFFEQTDMRKLKAHQLPSRSRFKQVQFIGHALGSGKQYKGKSMVDAHKNLRGLEMQHFNRVAQYLREALEELDVSKDVIEMVMAGVEDMRPQFEEAIQAQGDIAKPSAFERIGGAPAVRAAVDLLYEKLLSDGNCRQFFENTDMRRLKAHQMQFIRYALGGSEAYKGKDMVSAHKNLTGLQMLHFEAVARHLAEALRELNVPQGLIDEVIGTVGTLRPQFEEAVKVANA